METEEPVLFVLENAVFQSASMVSSNIQVGDLFVTQERLCFVPYASTTSPGTAGPAVAFLLDGLAGGAAASSTNRSYRDAGIRIANKQRKRFWGMSLTKRMKSNSSPIVILRNEILDIKVRLGTISLLTGKSDITFAVDRAKEQKDKLSKWCNGEFGTPSACAITSRYLAPSLALDALIAGNQSQELVDELNTASGDKNYMKHLWMVYELLPKERRQRVIKSLERFEGSFPIAFAKHRQSAIASGKEFILLGFAALVIAGLSGGYVAVSIINGHEEGGMSGLGFICLMITIISGGIGIGIFWQGYRAAKMWGVSPIFVR